MVTVFPAVLRKNSPQLGVGSLRNVLLRHRGEVMVVFVGGHVVRLLSTCFVPLIDAIRVARRSKKGLIAENLFLRRQLGLYQERKASRRRPCPATKLALVILSRFFDGPTLWRL
jgi:hypothetical protein